MNPRKPALIPYVALLRGVNVGGHAKVAMAELRDFVAGLGFDGVRSLLQSGNLVFRGKRQRADAIERLLEAEAKPRLDVHADFLVRAAAHWADLVANNPFPEQAARDPSRTAVMCLKAAPTGAAVAALQKAIVGRELVRAAGGNLYLVYPDGIGRSRLTHALIEKTLQTRGTARNWNTVLKIAALLQN